MSEATVWIAPDDPIPEPIVYRSEEEAQEAGAALHFAHAEAELQALLSDCRPTLATAPSPPGQVADERDLTAREAAQILRMVKPDGTPRDSFYRLLPKIGYRNGRGWRVRPAKLDSFRNQGGVQ